MKRTIGERTLSVSATGKRHSRSRWLQRNIFFSLAIVTFIAWFLAIKISTRDGAKSDIGDTYHAQQPEPVILPIPVSGNKTNPYFVNVTTKMEPSKRMTRNAVIEKAPYDDQHRGYYLVTTNYPWSVVLPNNNDDDESESPFLEKTTLQAANRPCDIVATNGGPFDEGGRWNSGPTVSNGKLIRTKPHPEDSEFVGFGIATREIFQNDRGGSKQSKASRNWIMGQYGQLVPSSSVLTLWDFVTGFGWLVYDGKPRVTRYQSSNNRDSSSDPTGAIRAPRTAVGLDKDSNLMLLVVDGCQHW